MRVVCLVGLPVGRAPEIAPLPPPHPILAAATRSGIRLTNLDNSRNQSSVIGHLPIEFHYLEYISR